jgi:hypothetical protein
MDAANQIYSSAQAAELLGIPVSTLRTWKARKKDQLQENLHWFHQDGQTFWTTQGLETLKQIQPSVADMETKASGVSADETPDVADPLQRYESLIEAVADAVSPQVVQRIDQAVMQRVKNAIAKPMTSQECIAILTDFGLAPADPNALLGSSVSGYYLAPETLDN